MDLRERVVAAVDGGLSRRAVARLFRLGEATVIRWARRHITTGSVAAKPMGGTRHDVLGSERAWLCARMAAAPDLTIRALRAELLVERGLRASNDAVWRFLRAEGLTFKKKPCGPPSRTDPTGPASASAGSATRDGLIPLAWSSSTRPGPKPT
jgi:transposase